MTEQNPRPGIDDDTTGHKVYMDADAGDDDTTGHKVYMDADAGDDDTEGHLPRH